MFTSNNITIIFKPYFLNKSIYWFCGIGIITSVIVFSQLPIDLQSKFQLNSVLVGVECFFLVYFNRYEPHYIIIDNNDFTVDYNNKFLFKYGTKSYKKSETKTRLNSDILILYPKLGRQVNIRKQAIEQKDWKILNEYFIPDNENLSLT